MNHKYKRDTVGKIALELMQKEPETNCAIELGREMTGDYMANLTSTIEKSKKVSPEDFYVEVMTRTERLMRNVVRNLFKARYSCPTPTYDQAVYKYTSRDDSIELLWVIPSPEACESLKDNAIGLHKDNQELLKYALDFSDGTLLNMAKKLNNEDVVCGTVLLKVSTENEA